MPQKKDDPDERQFTYASSQRTQRRLLNQGIQGSESSKPAKKAPTDVGRTSRMGSESKKWQSDFEARERAAHQPTATPARPPARAAKPAKRGGSAMRPKRRGY